MTFYPLPRSLENCCNASGKRIGSVVVTKTPSRKKNGRLIQNNAMPMRAVGSDAKERETERIEERGSLSTKRCPYQLVRLQTAPRDNIK